MAPWEIFRDQTITLAPVFSAWFNHARLSLREMPKGNLPLGKRLAGQLVACCFKDVSWVASWSRR